MPPPPAPASTLYAQKGLTFPAQSFQTRSPVGPPLGSSVPPTLSTSIWLVGSVTASSLGSGGSIEGSPGSQHAEDPSSPEAATIVWPWAAISAKTSASAA